MTIMAQGWDYTDCPNAWLPTFQIENGFNHYPPYSIFLTHSKGVLLVYVTIGKKIASQLLFHANVRYIAAAGTLRSQPIIFCLNASDNIIYNIFLTKNTVFGV